MKTGTLVVGMTGSGILGGIAGAWLFLTFFAAAPGGTGHDAGRAGGTDSRVPPPPPQFTDEEEATLRGLPTRVDELASAVKAMGRPTGGTPPGGIRPVAGPPVPAAGSTELDEARLRSNETAAIAILRNMCSCQAQIQASGKIDADMDGIGEYGTLLEMTGATGVRKSTGGGYPATSDFSNRGTKVSPAVMSPSLSAVDGSGTVVRSGYVFKVFLPDASSPAGWVHETGPGDSPGLSGPVAVDLSETTWCAYAVPVERGKSGNRKFFVNQSGDVMQAANDVAKSEGPSGITPEAAFIGHGITGRIAVGTAGRDGEVWKVTN